MKKIKNRKKIKQYQRSLYESSERKLSQGAEEISKIISWPRGENWRGNKESKK